MICSLLHIPCIITFQLLADLENSSLFTGDLECQKLLMEAMKYHLLPERRPMMQSPRTRPRKSTMGALYAVGGMDAMKGNRRKLITLAAVKSRQSCPTLCDPIDGSPPGSPIPGILQARTLEWVAISFSNA